MWEKLGQPTPFWIVEQGAEDARLAADILLWCRTEAPLFFDAVVYGMVETSSAQSRRQQEALGAAGLAGKASWFSSAVHLAEREPTGVFFANELVDAFPVHVIRRVEGAWKELHVTSAADDSLAWMAKKIESKSLAEAIGRLALPEIDGNQTEINLRARSGWKAWVGR